ncbi:MAG: YncE family protein [Chthonomonadales bacterium]
MIGLLTALLIASPQREDPAPLKLVKVITGRLNPKSVVHNGNGLFFAQNMMYLHTIAVYDRSFKRVRTISDRITPAKYGYPQFSGNVQGGPVECAFSHGGKFAWVSNYQMYGADFKNPGNDHCGGTGHHDRSFLYKIDTATGHILAAALVGSVPKYVAITPDNRLALVTNWCSYDMSVVDTTTCKEIRRIKLGRFPRGIAIDSSSSTAYVAMLGGTDIGVIDLKTYKVNWIRHVGASPRHLCLDPDGKFLYATLNGESSVAKIDVVARKLVRKRSTGNMPRSMVMTPDGKYLYIVNNGSDTLSRVRTSNLTVVQTVRTNHHPIGITYDAETKRVWVACYTTGLMVFQSQ